MSILQKNRLTNILEITFIFLLVITLMLIALQYVDQNPLLKQLTVWVINIFMMVLIWVGLRLRNQSLQDFGITFDFKLQKILPLIGRSLIVFIAAMAAFILGAIVMANITGIPESKDMSDYTYLKDNPYMLATALCAVYLVSSFGEELIYRAFIINRILEMGFGKKIGNIVAVLFSSVIFGLIHYEWGPMGMVQTGLMGLVLAVAYLKLKRSIWPNVLAHAYMDSILLVQLYLS